tara:strand:- start:220 stop:420 length:201 start_codon:yes stop_codon:yes gene_type:complete
MGFWKTFEKVAHFRLSWHIQDKIINSYNSVKNSNKKSASRASMLNNKNEIIDKVYNNNFSEKRIKK